MAEKTTKTNGKAAGPPRISRLNGLDDVRAELTRVYREARAGKLPLKDAKDLTYVLSVLSQITKEATLEDRIAAVERKLSAA